MKAAVFQSVGLPLAIEEVPDPKPNPSELILQIKVCGICGTDLHMSENTNVDGGWRLLKPGCVLGHEFSGEVVEIGREAGGSWKIGERVTALPWIGCGICSACFSGRPYRCSSVIMRGTLELPGAYSQFSRVGSNEVIRLPQGVSFREGALIEPLAVGFNAVRRAQIKSENSVLIIGAGPVGLSVTLWCRFFGVQNIIVADLIEARAKAALHLGATSIAIPNQGNDLAVIQEGSGNSPRIIFDCVGLPGSLQTAIDSAPSNARIIVVGLCMGADHYFPARALVKELDIHFSYVYCRDDFQTVAELINQRRIDPSPLISETVDLSDFPNTFEKLKKPDSQLKVILELN